MKVLIIGGGIGGLATALSLQAAGIRVTKTRPRRFGEWKKTWRSRHPSGRASTGVQLKSC